MFIQVFPWKSNQHSKMSTFLNYYLNFEEIEPKVGGWILFSKTTDYMCLCSLLYRLHDSVGCSVGYHLK